MITPRVTIALGAGLLVATAAGASLLNSNTATSPAEPDVAAAPAVAVAPDSTPVVTVYKSPTCGCCKNWVEHLKENGFAVEVHDLDDLTAVKEDAGVPNALRSCHTAIVQGYAIEGHVPADVLRRFLAEQPEAAGLAVPGMPMGSPGMEGPRTDHYDVVLFRHDGTTAVYASR